MKAEILAVLISEGGKIVTELLRTRPLHSGQEKEAIRLVLESPEVSESSQPNLASPVDDPSRATSIESGCVPCAIGHLGTCSGLLNEGMRYAHRDGIESPEVIDRVNMCLDELNTMERVDLRPEMIAALPNWEKGLANQALVASRDVRHQLEGIKVVDTLEEVAASTQTTRQEIGRNWFQTKLQNLTPEEKKRVQERVMQRLSTGGQDDTDE